jgi:hypothetical protein
VASLWGRIEKGRGGVVLYRFHLNQSSTGPPEQIPCMPFINLVIR